MNEPAGEMRSCFVECNADGLTDQKIRGDVERQEFSSEMGFDAVV